MIDPELLQILACPLDPSRPPLEVKGSYLVCTLCGHGFEIRDGVPDLLPEHAMTPRQLEEMLNER